MTFATVNDDGEIQHNIAKEERKTDVTSKICKIQEDGGQVVSYKFEQQNVNDLVVEAVPSGIVSFACFFDLMICMKGSLGFHKLSPYMKNKFVFMNFETTYSIFLLHSKFTS